MLDTDQLIPNTYRGNAIILALVAFYYFWAPLVLLIGSLLDPGVATSGVPGFTYSWHRQLSGRFEPWARERVESGRAGSLYINDISGTEWPIFSAVYYLWASESLQDSWRGDPAQAPNQSARGAIEAAAALVADPNHAAWVKKHWGVDYLSRENIFYRMLYISGLTSYQKLTGDLRYRDALRLQVDSLAQELDASPYGLLNDYPNQCYPIDILPAIAAIQRADRVLGTDHAAMVARAVRGFESTRLDPQTGLPAYIADPDTGRGIGPSRGVGVSYMLVWAPEVWPATASDWYTRYDRYFWQQDAFLAGVREFPRGSNLPDWFVADVDAGPVLAGYGTAASAFGLGAARANGRMDQAYPLAAEALVAAWPLPDGSLLVPRLLSNLSDAPYLGEAALLFAFTRQPTPGKAVTVPGSLPGVVYLTLAGYAGLGLLILLRARQQYQLWQTRLLRDDFFPSSGWQLTAWLALVVLGLLQVFSQPPWGLFWLCLAQSFPARYDRTRA